MCSCTFAAMKNFLKQIRLLDQLTVEIDGIHKNEFVEKLKNEVDPSDLGLFSDTFDAFSSGKNEFKGQVGYEGFKIKRKKRFFDMNMNLAVATGSFTQKEDKLIITTEINGFLNIMIPFYIFLILIYAVTGAVMLFSEGAGNEVVFAFPFLLFHGAFMMGIPYLIMRGSTRRLKRELEREFYFIAKR